MFRFPVKKHGKAVEGVLFPCPLAPVCQRKSIKICGHYRSGSIAVFTGLKLTALVWIQIGVFDERGTSEIGIVVESTALQLQEANRKGC